MNKPPKPPAIEISDYNKQTNVYSAVRWSAASKYLGQAIQYSVSFIMAAILAPELFGLLGMAMVFAGFAKNLANLGFRPVIIQRRDVDKKLLSTLFWINSAFAGLMSLGLAILSPVLSWSYQDERVWPIMAVLALTIFINSFATIPSALLQRKLEFSKLAIREIGAAVVSGVVGISMALMGTGVWALVSATVSTSIANVLFLNLAEPFRPEWTIDKKRLMESVNFGINITGFGVFNYFSRAVDVLIIGIMLGPVSVGLYSLALRFMNMPRDSITSVVTRVLFPKMAKTQEDDSRLARFYTRSIHAVSLAAFPMMFGISSVADSFVRCLLNSSWDEAIPIIQILAPIGAMNAVTVVSNQVYLAKGQSSLMLKLGIFDAIIMVISFFVGVNWGLIGVAVSYAFTAIPIFCLRQYFVSQQVSDFKISQAFAAMIQPLVGSFLCVSASLICQSFWQQKSLTTLIAASLCGAAVYASYILIADPESRQLVRNLTSAGNSRKAVST